MILTHLFFTINFGAIAITRLGSSIILLLFIILLFLGVISLYIVLHRKSLKVRELTLRNDFVEKQLIEENNKFNQISAKNRELNESVAFLKEQLLSSKKELEEAGNRVQEEVLRKTTELHTSLEKLAESNKIKEAFLEKISREIRTPLNSILGFINLLNDTNLAKIDRDYYLRYIRESGNNLLGLIDNIIDFTRLETGELFCEYKRCNMSILLADLVDKHRNRIMREKPEITIIYNKPDNIKESFTDCKRILHVLDQLINNAAKFTEKGKIVIDYEIKDNCHEFSISDTGIGIDQKYHDIIFERFYQIESEQREVFRGAGLGLAIAKGITDLLEGNLTVESDLGKGSCFVLRIPYRAIESIVKRGPGNDKTFDWHNKTILIAEDEDTNYHFLEAILKKTQAQILWATDGVKFLEIMNENKNIDLVLLDIKMPGINGYNAIKVIRQQSIDIPVIAQTAFNQPEDKQRCLDSGCNDYLSKPIEKELLLTKIARFFNS